MYVDSRILIHNCCLAHPKWVQTMLCSFWVDSNELFGYLTITICSVNQEKVQRKRKDSNQVNKIMQKKRTHRLHQTKTWLCLKATSSTQCQYFCLSSALNTKRVTARTQFNSKLTSHNPKFKQS